MAAGMRHSCRLNKKLYRMTVIAASASSCEKLCITKQQAGCKQTEGTHAASKALRQYPINNRVTVTPPPPLKKNSCDHNLAM